MAPVNTREGTDVFTALPPPNTIFRFTQKPVEVVSRFQQRVFSSDDRHEGDSILASLTQRLEEETARKRESKKPRRVDNKPSLTQAERRRSTRRESSSAEF